MARFSGKMVNPRTINLLLLLIVGLSFPQSGMANRSYTQTDLFQVNLPLVARDYGYFESSGVLDTSFNQDGLVMSDLSGGIESGTAMALQRDGKLLVGGEIEGSYSVDVGVARYLSDGSLDPTFGSGGWVSTDLLGDDEAVDIAIQPDGKILLACTTVMDFALVRYNPDGSLDITFGIGGWVRTDILGSDDQANALAIQSDGRIVVGGKAMNSNYNYDFALVRYLENGDLDTSFDLDGKVTTDLTAQHDIARGIAIQPDGKIIAVGPVKRTGYFHDFAVARYNVDGTLDTTFGSGGLVFTDFYVDHDFANSVVLQPDGRIVVAGAAVFEESYYFAVARYTASGLLDNSFDSDGRVVTYFGPGHDDGYAVALQPDGKLILASYADIGSGIDFVVVRYNPNGSLDMSFSEDGYVMTDFVGGEDMGLAVVLQLDGKVVVAGSAFNGVDTDFALARYK